MTAEERMDNFAYDPYCRLYLPLWKLDGGSFMSKDAYGHLCTTSSVWTPQGRDLNGGDNDPIIVPSASALDVTEAITMEAFISPRSFATGVDIPMISRKSGGYYFSVDNGYIRAEYHGGTKSMSADILTLNTFAHVVATYSQSQSYWGLFINGHEVSYSNKGDTSGGAIPTFATDLHVGSENTVWEKVFDGFIGLFLLFSRVLTPQEIQQHYLAVKELFG